MHLERGNLIAPSQHGFVKKKSCLTNLLEFNEFVTKQVDEGKAVDIIYLDFQKAFDKVPHGRLIKKLEAHGIKGKVSQWIEAWLKERRQRVKIGNCCSKWAEVRSGVTQ